MGPTQKEGKVMNGDPTPSLSSKTIDKKTLWVPTFTVERMMLQCQRSTSDTIEVSRQVLEGLLADVLTWRAERIAREASAVETFGNPPQRYKVQQDNGEYALKGCADGDLVDYNTYEALLRRLNTPAVKASSDPKIGDKVILTWTPPFGVECEGWTIAAVPTMGISYRLTHPNGSDVMVGREGFAVKPAIALPAASATRAST